MKYQKKICLAVALTASLFACGQTVQEVAVPYERPETVPSASDVSMRSLRFRPRNAEDPQDTFKAMDAFHVNRLQWTYLNILYEIDYADTTYTPMTLSRRKAELEKVCQVKESGRVFGGAAGSATGVFVEWNMQTGLHRYHHTMKDLDGNPLILGHTAAWKRPVSPGCMNNPFYRKNHLENLKGYVNAGATVLQRDEPSVQYDFAVKGLGCFCDHCIEGFRNYLKETFSDEQLKQLGVEDPNRFDYRTWLRASGKKPKQINFDWSDPDSFQNPVLEENSLPALFAKFQMKSTLDFFTWIRSELKAYNDGVPVQFSANNTSFQNWEEPYFMLFDFCLSEMMMQSANPAHIYERAQKARSLGKMQVFGTPKTMGAEVDKNKLARLKQQVVATAYAGGALAAVPWDVFMQSADGTSRYFCEPEDFAPVFGFVRANHRYLDGYCTAGGKGPGFEDNPYSGKFPVEFSNSNLCVTLRAVPGKKEAPVVIHLVDWTDGIPEPVELKLKTEAFFPGKKLRVMLRVPKAYDAVAHAAAEAAAQAMRKKDELLGPMQAMAYESLVTETMLETVEDNDFVRITVPAVAPWGILIVCPVS